MFPSVVIPSATDKVISGVGVGGDGLDGDSSPPQEIIM